MYGTLSYLWSLLLDTHIHSLDLVLENLFRYNSWSRLVWQLRMLVFDNVRNYLNLVQYLELAPCHTLQSGHSPCDTVSL